MSSLLLSPWPLALTRKESSFSKASFQQIGRALVHSYSGIPQNTCLKTWKPYMDTSWLQNPSLWLLHKRWACVKMTTARIWQAQSTAGGLHPSRNLCCDPLPWQSLFPTFASLLPSHSCFSITDFCLLSFFWCNRTWGEAVSQTTSELYWNTVIF